MILWIYSFVTELGMILIEKACLKLGLGFIFPCRCYFEINPVSYKPVDLCKQIKEQN